MLKIILWIRTNWLIFNAAKLWVKSGNWSVSMSVKFDKLNSFGLLYFSQITHFCPVTPPFWALCLLLLLARGQSFYRGKPQSAQVQWWGECNERKTKNEKSASPKKVTHPTVMNNEYCIQDMWILFLVIFFCILANLR